MAVAVVRAVNVSKVPQTTTIIYTRLWLKAGAPWTISALSEATSLDRASIRDHLKKFAASHFTRTDEGIELTQEGRRRAYQLTEQFYRGIAPEDRYYIKRFFSTKYAGRHPYRKLSEFFMELDRCTRRIPYSIAFRTVLTAMDVMGPKGAEWTISQLVDETAYSYQAVHKVLQMIVEEGFATKSGRKFKISTRGKLKCVSFFFAALRRADIRTLKVFLKWLFPTIPHPNRPKSLHSPMRAVAGGACWLVDEA